MRGYMVPGFIMVIIGCIVVGYIIYEQVNTHYVCNTEATVLDILSVNYRSATILTDKGEVVLNQPTIKDGDTICLSGERIRNEE